MNEAAVRAPQYDNWHVAHVQSLDHHMYVLELHRGDGETAYVDVQAWETRDGDCHLAVLGAEKDAISQSAAAWVAAQPEHELGALVLDWRTRRAS